MWPVTRENNAHIGANEKIQNSAHQFGACILNATIVLLCIVIGGATSCTHSPEVIFCVEHSLLQLDQLFILSPLCAPLADNGKCRW